VSVAIRLTNAEDVLVDVRGLAERWEAEIRQNDRWIDGMKIYFFENIFYFSSINEESVTTYTYILIPIGI